MFKVNLSRVSVLLFVLSSSVIAQTSGTTGAVRGSVTDPSGAVVASANVTLINSSNAIRRETKTESDGTYLFPLVPPAAGYEVDVEVPGFAKSVVQDIVVRVSEITSTPITLMVARQASEVSVSAAAQTVNTSNASTGNTLPQEVISVLPLNTRNTIQLLATDAGVAADTDNVTIFAGGNRSTYNNYSMNGINSNNFEFNSLDAVPAPNPDSVQEFRTQTSLYDASVGRNSGAYISLVSRSGTERIHGTLYEYNRNRAMAANTFFLNRNGIPAPPFVRNQFGASLGGPLPDKKTFWFFNYEGTRQSTGSSVNGFEPVLPASRTAASLASAFSVPVSAIDPVALKILNLPGQFNGQFFPSGIGAPVGQLGTFAAAGSSALVNNQYSARVDRGFDLLGGTNRVSGTYFRNGETSSNLAGLGFGQLSTGGSQFSYLNDNYAVNDTQIFTPTLLNEFSIGFTRYRILGNNAVHPATLSEIGMTRFNQSLYPDAPELSFSDQFGGFGTNQEARPQQDPWTFSVRDTVSYTRGKHTFRFGYEESRDAFNFNESYDFRGFLGFFPIWADTLYGPPANPAGDISFRDFLIGAPTEVSIASGVNTTQYRANDLAAFIQDDYRVDEAIDLEPRLALGIFRQHQRTARGRFRASIPVSFRLRSPPLAATGFSQAFSFRRTFRDLVSLAFPEAFCTTRTTRILRHASDSPTMSSATRSWRFAAVTAFTITASRRSARFRRTIKCHSAYRRLPSRLRHLASDTSGAKILSNPFPTLPLPSQFPVITPVAQLTGYDQFGNPIFSNNNLLSLSALDPHSHTPYTEEWNFTIQYAFVPSWLLEVGYLGSHGQRLLNDVSFNNALLRNSNNPAAFGLITNSAANREARVGTVGLSEFSSNQTTNASSYYDGLLLTVQHQFSRGLFFKAAYTYSKAIDDDSASFDFEITGPPGNQFLPYLNKGLSDFDQPHRLVLTYVYNLPGPKSGLLRYPLGGLVGQRNHNLQFRISVQYHAKYERQQRFPELTATRT